MMNQTLRERVFLVYMTFPRPFGRGNTTRHYIDSFQTRAFLSHSDAINYQEKMNDLKLQGKFEVTEIELK